MRIKLLILNLKPSIFLFLAMIVCFSGFSQAKTQGIPPDQKDLVILTEANTIRVNGVHTEHQFFTIVKKITYKIISEEGVKMLSNYTIPLTFDPTYIPHAPITRNVQGSYFIDRINYFRGVVHSSDGETHKIKKEHNAITLRSVSPETDRFVRFRKYIYNIKNLKIGDVVDLSYSYDLDYSMNFYQLSSFRFFFNDTIYKKKFSLKIIHNIDENIRLELRNDTLEKKEYTEKKNVFYVWETTNLRGCIKEVGARPYLSLPHIVFDFRSNYYRYSSGRNRSYANILNAIRYNKKTVQNFHMNKFIEKELQEVYQDSLEAYKYFNLNREYEEKELEEDYFDEEEIVVAREEEFLKEKSFEDVVLKKGLGVEYLIKMHTKIVDDFEFETDEAYFNVDDNHKFKFGENLIKENFRDLNRYSTYAAIATRLGLGYIPIYTTDIRSGIIDKKYCYPMYDSDSFFGIIQKDYSLRYIYPKKAKFGYYVDEFPFYFEGGKAIAKIKLNKGKGKKGMRTSFRDITLPTSNEKDNVRSSSVEVNVNLNSNSVAFKAKVRLRGQYSTLVRGLYQYNYKDETINDKYHLKIWEINDNVKLDSSRVLVVNKDFPYPTLVNAHYEVSGLIENKNDTLSLNLKNWFNHVIYPNFDAENRQLDFYPDFYGKDTYVYFILFDKPVKLIATPKEVTIKNELGELQVEVEQRSPKSVRIISYFVTNTKKVIAQNSGNVAIIFDEIKELNNSKLLFTIVE